MYDITSKPIQKCHSSRSVGSQPSTRLSQLLSTPLLLIHTVWTGRRERVLTAELTTSRLSC